MKRYVVEDSIYGYWENLGCCKRTTDLQHCDKFRFWITAFISYFNQIAYDARIKKIDWKE